MADKTKILIKGVSFISNIIGIADKQVLSTIKLLEEDNTIPFISRYRKEQTGGLDETEIKKVKEEWDKFNELEKRRETILATIKKQGKLTPELEKKIRETNVLQELEDLYLPYKPKKITKAKIAKEKGLEPLAKIIFEQKEEDLMKKAETFVKDKVKDLNEALSGARDIIAEWINEDKKARDKIRDLFENEAEITSKVLRTKKEEASKYKDYFAYKGLLKECPSHRLLAIRRGENEGFLRVNISPSEEKAIGLLNELFIKADNDCSIQVELAIEDSYQRLLEPSIENEFAKLSKEKADEEAIKVFVKNLHQLLLAPPLGQKRVMGIDPGFRTGCKVVCLDVQGNLLHYEAIFPNEPVNQIQESGIKIQELVDKYQVEAIAIGNGTASRETESFIRNSKLDRGMEIFMVSENGASVYSASEVAREEFPDYDVTVRGAVSIARRLIDPLAELVKIDPKSIGVGQYQHDVDQKKLRKSLDMEVESCVNSVGVQLNTASKHLLTYVSGLGPQLAQNIVDYRKENGDFSSRAQLKKVKKMGPKAFEQCAGFLRIQGAKNPLDNSAVHPERYKLVETIAKDLKIRVKDLIDENDEYRSKIDVEKYVDKHVGLPTLEDIMAELAKPGRDPRGKLKAFVFGDVHDIKDLKVGMKLPGIITNITNFGCFVDIGVHQDGLVHISEMSDKYVSNPEEIVDLHQHVKVRVLEIDEERKRITLSMKGNSLNQSNQSSRRRGDSSNSFSRKAEKPQASSSDDSAATAGFRAQLEALKGRLKDK